MKVHLNYLFQTLHVTGTVKVYYSKLAISNSKCYCHGESFTIPKSHHSNIFYLSLSNNNAENIPESNKFEFVDDLTVLEPINLRKAGIASYNSKLNVPSNVPTHNQIIHKDNLKSKEYISEIN